MSVPGASPGANLESDRGLVGVAVNTGALGSGDGKSGA